ncbi:MAG TPA: acylphosphatase [Woeseiaceae bacterium]
MTVETRLFTVQGRVQGVWFRDSTRREAERLGITGHAKNLMDGSVEVLASGPSSALDELATWLRQGPPLAAVKAVDVVTVAHQDIRGFRIG